MKRCFEDRRCPHAEEYDDGTVKYDNCGFHGQPLSEIEQCHLSEVKWSNCRWHIRLIEWLKKNWAIVVMWVLIMLPFIVWVTMPFIVEWLKGVWR